MSNIKDSGSFGKGLEKLFRGWERRTTVEEANPSEEIPSLPQASPLGTQSSLILEREVRLLTLLCVSVALMCLNWATMDGSNDNWQGGRGGGTPVARSFSP
jgi:hypothetical protein